MHGARNHFIFFLFFIAVSFMFAIEVQANVILKVVSVNPSKEQSQTVDVKAYLPKETKPEHIIDKGDLEIAYDTQQGSYYVFGTYELKPLEVFERTIELRDIWTIPQSEIEPFLVELVKMRELLKDSEFSDRSAFLINSIESKVNQIVENQKNPPSNPERHISDYRENVKTLESIKAEMALARNLLAQVKTISSATIWRLILAIVLFLGLLGLSFYFLWHKQIKVISQESSFYVPEKENKAESTEKKE